MSEPAVERRLTPERVDYRGPVRLLPPDRRASLWVQSSDLCETGICVAAPQLFAVGTEVGLDIPLPGDRGSLACRGRVAWVEPEQRGCMGIHFIDLTVDDQAMLRRLVNGIEPTTWARPVKVWFEGQALPTPAHAVPSTAGLTLSLKLPHLRRHSQVFYRWSDEQGQSALGVLQGVTLEQGSVPLLLATILSPEAVSEGTGSEEAVNVTVLGPEAAGSEAPGAVLPPDRVTPPEGTLLETDDGIPVILEPVQVLGDDTIVPLKRLSDAATLPVEQAQIVSAQPEAEAAPRPAEARSAEAARSVALSPPSSAADLETSHWSLGPLPTELLSSEPFSELRRRETASQHHFWLWTAAILMAVLALGSMAYTGLLDRGREQVLSWLRPPTTAGSGPTEKPLPVAPAPAPTASMAPASPAPIPSLPPVMTRGEPMAPAPRLQAPPASGFSTTTPELRVADGQTLVRIPIAGRTDGLQVYGLDDPEALAINLPQARSTDRYGSFPLSKGPVRLYWVRERLGGLHLRLFFRGQMPEFQVKVTNGELWVTLTPSDDVEE